MHLVPEPFGRTDSNRAAAAVAGPSLLIAALVVLVVIVEELWGDAVVYWALAAAYVLVVVTLRLGASRLSRAYALPANPLLAAAPIYLMDPHDPWIWFVYLLSSSIDAARLRKRYWYLCLVAAVPWLMWTADPARVTAGEAVIASAMAAVMYLWISTTVETAEMVAAREWQQAESTLRNAEREPLGLELLDTLGHNLTGIAAVSTKAAAVMATDRARAGRLLHEAEQLSRRGLQRLRLTMRSLSGSEVDWPEFEGIVRASLVESWGTDASLRFVVAEDTPRVDERIAFNFALFLGEAVEALLPARPGGRLAAAIVLARGGWTVEATASNDASICPLGPTSALEKRAAGLKGQVTFALTPGTNTIRAQGPWLSDR